MSNFYIRAGKEYTVPEALKQVLAEAKMLENEFCLIADKCEFYDEDKDIYRKRGFTVTCRHEDNLFFGCVMNKCPFGQKES